MYAMDADDKIINSYYAKTTGNMPRAEFAPDLKPEIDLTEIFVYQLFKLIGVGASDVCVMPDLNHSGCVYLATSISKLLF